MENIQIQEINNTFDIDSVKLTSGLSLPLYIDLDSLINDINESGNQRNNPREIVEDTTSNEYAPKEDDKLMSLLVQKKRRKLPHYSMLMSIAQVHHLQLCFTVEENKKLENMIERQQQLKYSLNNKWLAEMPDEIITKYKTDYIDSMENNKNIQEAPFNGKEFLEMYLRLQAEEGTYYLEEFHSIKKHLQYKIHLHNAPATLALLEGLTMFEYSGQGWLQQCEFAAPGTASSMFENCNYESWRDIQWEDVGEFRSPWAESLEMEIFVKNTLREVAAIVGRDLKLAAIYSLLLLASNPSNFKITSKKLNDLQNEMGEMLYRYLASTRGHFVAGDLAYKLVSYIDRLFRAGDIILYKRININ